MCRLHVISRGEDFAEFEGDGDFELVVGALVGRLVGAPALEAGDAAEALRLQLIELDLDDALDPHGLPRQVLLRVPPAHRAGHPPSPDISAQPCHGCDSSAFLRSGSSSFASSSRNLAANDAHTPT